MSRYGYDADTLFKLTIPFDAIQRMSGKPILETDKAYGFRMNDVAIFLPKSMIREVENGDTEFTCLIPPWLVERNGLDMFVEDENYSAQD